jgi:uncharacterized membrane protein
MNLDSQNWIDSIDLPSHIMNLLLLLSGVWLMYFPPKKVNALYGYRTNRSMKNQEVWDFSQRYAGRKMIQMSFASIIISLLITLLPIPFVFKSIAPIILGITGLILVLYLTEKKIKSNF